MVMKYIKDIILDMIFNKNIFIYIDYFFFYFFKKFDYDCFFFKMDY